MKCKLYQRKVLGGFRFPCNLTNMVDSTYNHNSFQNVLSLDQGNGWSKTCFLKTLQNQIYWQDRIMESGKNFVWLGQKLEDKSKFSSQFQLQGIHLYLFRPFYPKKSKKLVLIVIRKPNDATPLDKNQLLGDFRKH